MPSCSCHPGISQTHSVVAISWCRWCVALVKHSAGQLEGLALNQSAARLGENRTLGLSNGIMGEEGGLKSSSGQPVSHHCPFCHSPVLLFFILVPLIDSLQLSSLPIAVPAVPLAVYIWRDAFNPLSIPWV